MKPGAKRPRKHLHYFKKLYEALKHVLNWNDGFTGKFIFRFIYRFILELGKSSLTYLEGFSSLSGTFEASSALFHTQVMWEQLNHLHDVWVAPVIDGGHDVWLKALGIQLREWTFIVKLYVCVFEVWWSTWVWFGFTAIKVSNAFWSFHWKRTFTSDPYHVIRNICVYLFTALIYESNLHCSFSGVLELKRLPLQAFQMWGFDPLISHVWS